MPSTGCLGVLLAQRDQHWDELVPFADQEIWQDVLHTGSYFNKHTGSAHRSELCPALLPGLTHCFRVGCLGCPSVCPVATRGVQQRCCRHAPLLLLLLQKAQLGTHKFQFCCCCLFPSSALVEHLLQCIHLPAMMRCQLL